MIGSSIHSVVLNFQKIAFITWTAIKTYLNGPYYSYLELNRNLQLFGNVRKLSVDDEDIVNDLNGKVCIITGGTRGIGLEVVKTLLKKGCHVITGSSADGQEIEKRHKAIVDQLSDQCTGQLDIWPLDLSSMDSVMQFIDKFKQSGLSVNYLICNGAVMFAPFKLTADNFETHLAVNYLSHCLLIAQLVDSLAESAKQSGHKSRIVCVSSGAHRASTIRFQDIHCERLFSIYHAYAQSKLAQIMFAYKFNEWLTKTTRAADVTAVTVSGGHQLSDFITIACLHPGVCRTDLMKEFNFFNLRPIQSLPIFRNAEEGAETTIYATLSSHMEDISGVYLEDCRVTKSSQKSYDKLIQQQLWTTTWKLLDKWTNNTMLYVVNQFADNSTAPQQNNDNQHHQQQQQGDQLDITYLT
ncbi:dehydrogenase/reductase SDR family member on chromosome X-like [Oppia nitens]|uniref:dehydrogenase/reductase SDR family member on chromosome X-like n=1 Tax=Oppia nitens TaxID=1686743 RepID=UPI0023DB113A|nr:dehydrogenase/reductase SDR family member on chromosome X-like [Oppia nitens]